jgi:hypothetical protein
MPRCGRCSEGGLVRRRELGHIFPRIYTVGLDLGQAQDPSAVVIVETEVTTRVWRDEWSAEPRTRPESVEHRVRHAERLPLQLPYPDQVAYVRGLMMTPELPAKETELVIDMTGVGRPVFDLFEVEGLRPVGVVITGGLEEVRDGARVHRVPKILLVSRLQAALHSGELKFSPELAEAEALKQEFSEFRMRATDTGRLTFGAREGRHDDLVLALAVAVWRAQGRTRGAGVSRSRLLGV